MGGIQALGTNLSPNPDPKPYAPLKGQCHANIPLSPAAFMAAQLTVWEPHSTVPYPQSSEAYPLPQGAPWQCLTPLLRSGPGKTMVSSTTVTVTIGLVCDCKNSPTLVYPLANWDEALFTEDLGSNLPSHGLKMTYIPYTDPSHLLFSCFKVSFSLTECTSQLITFFYLLTIFMVLNLISNTEYPKRFM